jgi:hypothetical protein
VLAAPDDPLTSTPHRAAGSVRRTTSVDILRPDGMLGDVVLHGRARDVLTPEAGRARPEVLAEAELDARVALRDRRLLSLELRPAEAAAAGLVGRTVGAGFRAAIDPRLAGTPAAVLLDDLPVAALISGYAALRVEPAPGAPDMARASLIWASRGDICSGWRTDGMMMRQIEGEGTMPVPACPPAPLLEDPGDPEGWHPLAPLPPVSMRRRRRIDVARGEADTLVVDAMFRDSFWEPSGVEVVLHEYGLDAVVEETGRIRSIAAEPHVLPWPECPVAADSAARLVGVEVEDLPDTVKQDLRGVSSCTHLNDLLRSLRDVRRLGMRTGALPS